jgi:hypothetical protein
LEENVRRVDEPPDADPVARSRFWTRSSTTVENGRVTQVYVVRNPHKLARLDEPAELAR